MALINEGQVLGSGSTDLILNTRGKIYVRVNDRFYELNFKGGGNEGNTVVNNTTINNPEQDLSPYVTKKYLKAALGEYVTKRNWEDVMQTKEALENAQLDGFTESITPITVNTMQMVVGTQNLQFDFINSLTDATVVPPSLYINESEQLVCPRGVIKHYTLFGPESVKPETNIKYYARWTIQGDDGGDYTLLDLEEEDKPYYIYLIVPTTNFDKYTDDYVTEHITEDPKGQYTGNWFASVEPHAIDELEGYAYLLVAIVTGSNAKGRSIGYLNGFTEILPGQITAYVFKTADGDQYLDFLNRNFKIGDDKSYMSWNTTDGLVVKGKISVIGGDLYDELDNLQKQIDDEIQAWFTSDNNDPNIENKHILPGPRLDGDIFVEDILWPTTNWTTDSIKKEHLGDLYYITEGDYSGKIFRYIKDSSSSSVNFYWIEVVDNALAKAVQISYIARSEAQNAQNFANNLNQHIISSLSDGVLTQSEKTNLKNYLDNLQISYGELKRTYDILYQNIFLDETKKSELKTYFDLLNETYTSLTDSVNNIISQPITEPGTTNIELENLNNIFITTYNDFVSALNNYQTKVIEIQKIINSKIDDNFNSYEYLTKSLAKSENTEIKGGLVLTSMVELGSKLSGNFEVTAGINGLIVKPNKNDIAFWAGGDFIDRQYDTISENDRPAKIVLRHDGTGYLADGLFKWDKDKGVNLGNDAIKINYDGSVEFGGDIKIGGTGEETLDSLLTAVATLFNFWKIDENTGNLVTDRNVIISKNLTVAGDTTTGGKGEDTGVSGTVTGIRVDSNIILEPTNGIVDMSDVLVNLDVDLSNYYTKQETTSEIVKAVDDLNIGQYAKASDLDILQTALDGKQDSETAITKSNIGIQSVAYATNAETIGGLSVDSFVRRDTTQAFLDYFDLQSIPRNVTQVGSIGWSEYQTHRGAGGMFLTFCGASSLRSLLLFAPDYNNNENIEVYTAVDYGNWQGMRKLAWTSDIPTDNNQLANGAGYITSSGSCAYATSADIANSVNTLSVLYHWDGDVNTLSNYISAGKLFGATNAPLDYYSFLSFGAEDYLTQINCRGDVYYMRSKSESGWHEWHSLYHSGNCNNASTPWSCSNLTASGNLIIAGDTATGSDIRFKDVIKDHRIALESIAQAPLFTFKWNDREDKTEHLGTSAQYWESVAPWLVKGTDFKVLDYSTLGVAIGISLANKTVNLEERVKILERENEQLKKQIRYGS